MSCDSVFPLSKHFLMLNAHMCAKINAHGVVMLLVTLSKDGTPNLFKPWLMSILCTLFKMRLLLYVCGQY